MHLGVSQGGVGVHDTSVSEQIKATIEILFFIF